MRGENMAEIFIIKHSAKNARKSLSNANYITLEVELSG